MDMSSTTAVSDMEGWKPYLHTSLLSPFPNHPDQGKAFLFPTFRIYSRATFLAACLFTFVLALVERWMTFLLDGQLSLHPPPSAHNDGSRKVRRRNAGAERGCERSVCVHLPDTTTTNNRRGRRRGRKVKLLVRNAVYFAATLLRYVLMIISMGMDWMMLLSTVMGLTLGHLLTDLWSVSASDGEGAGRARAEEVELLEEEGEEGTEDDKDGGRDQPLQERDAPRQSAFRRTSISGGRPY